MPIYKDLKQLIWSTSDIHGLVHKAYLVSLISILMAFLIDSLLNLFGHWTESSTKHTPLQLQPHSITSCSDDGVQEASVVTLGVLGKLLHVITFSVSTLIISVGYDSLLHSLPKAIQ